MAHFDMRYPVVKVENIIKGSLDLIPSPSGKIQIMDEKVCLRCEGKNIAVHCQQTFENKKFVDNNQQCSAFTLQANFPAHNLNFP